MNNSVKSSENVHKRNLLSSRPTGGDSPPRKMNKIDRIQIEEILQEFVNRLGVVSLSARPDNTLMWAHYANDHKGMCLEPEKISSRERKRRIVLKNSFGNVGLRDSTINRTEGQDDAGQR
jgi:hypothetical protein